MNKAGADVPSANRITLLRDTDGDGMAMSDYRARLLTHCDDIAVLLENK